MQNKKNSDFEVASQNIPERSEIDEKYKWKLTDIFKSDEEWENVFSLVSKKISGYKNFFRY